MNEFHNFLLLSLWCKFAGIGKSVRISSPLAPSRLLLWVPQKLHLPSTFLSSASHWVWAAEHSPMDTLHPALPVCALNKHSERKQSGDEREREGGRASGRERKSELGGDRDRKRESGSERGEREGEGESEGRDRGSERGGDGERGEGGRERAREREKERMEGWVILLFWCNATKPPVKASDTCVPCEMLHQSQKVLKANSDLPQANGPFHKS